MPFPPAVVAAAVFGIVLIVPFGLYALLTRAQRRTTREIRIQASTRGWRYRRRHWMGDPTAFRIDGRTPQGLPWILTTRGTSGYDKGWSVSLEALFPSLGNGQASGIAAQAFPGCLQEWPAQLLTPHSLLSWQDQGGLKLVCRLPAPPDWATVVHFLAVAEELATRFG